MTRKFFLICFLMFLFTGCFSQKSISRHGHPHTQKLKKRILLKFLKIDSLEVQIADELMSSSITVFAVDDLKNKKVLLKQDLDSNFEKLNYELPASMENTVYIIAIFEAKDINGNVISEVATYKVGEQEEINSAKERLKN